MGWIHRESEVHRCSRPTYQDTPGVQISDVWRCDTCQTKWQVTGFDSGMQWDPYPTQIKWQRVEERPGYYTR